MFNKEDLDLWLVIMAIALFLVLAIIIVINKEDNELKRMGCLELPTHFNPNDYYYLYKDTICPYH